MTKVLISEKYLHDIANAIRVKLDSQSTYTPAQMAAAIADITGTISGTITPSTDTDKVLVTDSNLTAIANAIRAKLDVATTYTPSQMADAILSIQSAGPTIVSWSTGTDEEVAAMIDAAHNGEIDLQQDGGWAVGDVRTIHIDAFTNAFGVSRSAQDIDIVITSFDEYQSCGNVLQFDFKDALADAEKLTNETYDPNHGGYGAMPFKTTTVPAIVNALPSWLQSRLIEFSVLADTGGYTPTTTTVQGNKLALRSQLEVCNSSSGTSAEQGYFLTYYNTADNKKKKRGHSGAYDTWWFRSTQNSNHTNFTYWWNDGSQVSAMAAYTTSGIVLFGCL